MLAGLQVSGIAITLKIDGGKSRKLRGLEKIAGKSALGIIPTGIMGNCRYFPDGLLT